MSRALAGGSAIDRAARCNANTRSGAAARHVKSPGPREFSRPRLLTMHDENPASQAERAARSRLDRGMAFAWCVAVTVRSHHEPLSLPALIAAITLLAPVAGAWWARIAGSQPKKNPPREGDL
jgi:hypothetical protein